MYFRDRHVSILVTCLVFIGLGALFAVLVQSGIREQKRAREQRDALARLVEQLTARKESFEKEREGLQNDPVFIEREARRLLGYIKSGERSVRKPAATAVEAQPDPKAPYDRVPRPFVENVRGWVGAWQMALAVALVILVAVAVGLGFGGRWRAGGPASQDLIAADARPTTIEEPSGKGDKARSAPDT